MVYRKPHYMAGLTAPALAYLYAALGDRQQQEVWRVRSRDDYLKGFRDFMPIGHSELRRVPGGADWFSNDEDRRKHRILCEQTPAQYERCYAELDPAGHPD
ncbi:MAG TPA: hypothetical protein VGX23_26040 [Actinocrinis sp.]|nr:hypothetical protein [Actinocrinis sp.]